MGLQLKCKENGWNLPSRCPDCKAAAERVKSIASTRTEKNWIGQIKRDESGRPIKFHYSKDGRQVGQTKTETNWLGQVKTDGSGRPIRSHFDNAGKKAGQSATKQNWFGQTKKDETGK